MSLCYKSLPADNIVPIIVAAVAAGERPWPVSSFAKRFDQQEFGTCIGAWVEQTVDIVRAAVFRPGNRRQPAPRDPFYSVPEKAKVGRDALDLP